MISNLWIFDFGIILTFERKFGKLHITISKVHVF